jgi:hypothetical protein
MTEPTPDRALVITFTDLIYASLAAYGLGLLNTALNQRNGWAVAYLAASAVWLFYDWYANHYFAIEQQLGGRNLPLDAISLAQYAGLLYTAATTSSWLFLFLTIRALRGILYNELALRHPGDGPYDPERLRSYNYSSGFMAVVYTGLLIWERQQHKVDIELQFGLAVGVWLVAYAISLLAEKRLDKRRSKEAESLNGSECLQ